MKIVGILLLIITVVLGGVLHCTGDPGIRPKNISKTLEIQPIGKESPKPPNCKSEQIGTLNARYIDESSGVAFSKRHPGRIYHVNDSGDGPNLYTTDLKGLGTARIRIKKFDPKDSEDLALGACLDDPTLTESCLYVGDIGDNYASRKYVRVVMIKEPKKLTGRKKNIKPRMRLKLEYPDGPLNSESMAVHPNGDLYFASKESAKIGWTGAPVRFYRLSLGSFQASNRTKKDHLILEYVGGIDLPFLASQLGERNPDGQVATSMDISADGKSFVLLTYIAAYEFMIDLSAPTPFLDPVKSRKMKPGTDFRKIDLRRLAQQEAIAYFPDQSGFLYTTEFVGQSPPLMKVTCP